MSRPLRPISRRRAARAAEQAAEAAGALAMLTPDALARIMARLEERPVADGWPSGGDDSGVRATFPSSSVERAALRRLRKPTPDPVGEAGAALVHHVRSAHREAMAAARLVQVLAHTRDSATVLSASVVDCAACGCVVTRTETDRLRVGLCGGCYQAWRRWLREHPAASDPAAERARWVRARRESLAPAAPAQSRPARAGSA